MKFSHDEHFTENLYIVQMPNNKYVKRLKSNLSIALLADIAHLYLINIYFKSNSLNKSLSCNSLIT